VTIGQGNGDAYLFLGVVWGVCYRGGGGWFGVGAEGSGKGGMMVPL